MDLPLLSALFLLFVLTLYVVLDGFDLGVGVLLFAQRDQRVRDRMVDAIAPTWDGNETWLIMAGITFSAPGNCKRLDFRYMTPTIWRVRK